MGKAKQLYFSGVVCLLGLSPIILDGYHEPEPVGPPAPTPHKQVLYQAVDRFANDIVLWHTDWARTAAGLAAKGPVDWQAAAGLFARRKGLVWPKLLELAGHEPVRVKVGKLLSNNFILEHEVREADRTLAGISAPVFLKMCPPAGCSKGK